MCTSNLGELLLSRRTFGSYFFRPLNGLDIKTRDWPYGFLRQLKESGKTLIVSTRDQSLADALADYFVYMGEQHEYSDMPHVLQRQVAMKRPPKKRRAGSAQCDRR